MRPIQRELAAAGLPQLERTAWVEVDTARLINNASVLRALVSPVQLGVVVKADGYGHGLEVAARSAVRGGATWLCVATLPEALRLRDDGYSGRIFVLYPIPPSVVDAARREEIDVTVSSLEDVDAMSRAAGLGIHIEVDTGMTRGGCRPEDVPRLVDRIRTSQAVLTGIWTHLASPEDPQMTATQVDALAEVTESIEDLDDGVEVTHAAASGGILTADLANHNLTRAGLIYYGSDPGVGVDLPQGIKPALEIRAHAVRIATVPRGTGVGYGSTWRTTRRSRIATIPMGYADGWARSLSPGSDVLVNGVRAPVVGRISSDAMTIDVSDVPHVDRDTDFRVMGYRENASITADEIASHRGTISWEVLQQLSPRLARVYRYSEEIVGLRAESTSHVVYAPNSPLPYRHR